MDSRYSLTSQPSQTGKFPVQQETVSEKQDGDIQRGQLTLTSGPCVHTHGSCLCKEAYNSLPGPFLNMHLKQEANNGQG